MNQIPLNQTERILTTVTDADGSTITDLTNVFLIIARRSDAFLYDFASSLFKSSSWVSSDTAMLQFNSTMVPGTYYYDFETSGFAADSYLMRSTCSSASNMPQEDELQVGGQAQESKELWRIAGLDSSVPVSVATSSIRAGASIIIEVSGIPTTKVVKKRV